MLTALPIELIDLILNWFTLVPASHLGTLATVCACNRALRNLCESRLYQCVLLRDGLGQAALFRSTLLQRPDLASLVRELYLHFSEYYTDVDADAAALLPLLRGLRKLEIEGQWRITGNTPFWKSRCGGSESLSRTFEDMVEPGLHPDRDKLPQLEELALNYTNSDSGWHMDKREALFLNKNIKSLTIRNAVYFDPTESRFTDAEINITNLHTLRLVECNIDPATLRRLLRFPAALRTLELRLPRNFPVSARFTAELPAYVRALAPQQASLQHITLPTTGWARERALDPSDFYEFKRLRSLEVYMSILFGNPVRNSVSDVLGTLPSLEHLTLNYCSRLGQGAEGDQAIDQRNLLLLDLAACAPQLPQLCRLTLHEERVVASIPRGEPRSVEASLFTAMRAQTPHWTQIFGSVGIVAAHIVHENRRHDRRARGELFQEDRWMGHG